MTELDFDALMRADIAFQNAYYGLGGTKSDGVRAAITAYLAATNLPPEGPTVQVVRKIDEPHWVKVEHMGVVLVEGFLATPTTATSVQDLLDLLEADRISKAALLPPGSDGRSWQLGHNKGLADAITILKDVLS